MRKGTRIHFDWEGVTAHTVYKGPKSEAKKAVFAVIEKPAKAKPSLSGRLLSKMGGSWKRAPSDSKREAKGEEAGAPADDTDADKDNADKLALEVLLPR